MYLFCFVKQPICQTPTKMSPADAEDTLINNLFFILPYIRFPIPPSGIWAPWDCSRSSHGCGGYAPQ